MDFSSLHRPPSRRWRLPLGVSLLIHVLSGVLVWWACLHWSPIELAASVEFDNRVVDEEEKGIEVAWLDVDVNVQRPLPRRPAPQLPSVTPPPVVEPAAHGPSAAPAWVPGGVSKEEASSVPGEQGTGGNAAETTAFFQVPAQGRSVVYVIDRSSSMGAGGRLALARRELLASLGRLRPPVCFQIIAYNRHPEALRVAGRVELLLATEENKQLAARFLAELVAEGSTEHGQALDQAVALRPDVIYFLTDADDLKREEVRALTQLNRGRCTIHAIEMSTGNRDKLEMPMHVLARTNGGSYRAVDVRD
jgi:hypothetical protein